MSSATTGPALQEMGDHNTFHLTQCGVEDSTEDAGLSVRYNTPELWTSKSTVRGSIMAKFCITEQLANAHQEALYTDYRAELTIASGGEMDILSWTTLPIDEKGSKRENFDLRKFKMEFGNITPQTVQGNCTVTVSISPVRRAELKVSDPLLQIWKIVDRGEKLIAVSFDVIVHPEANPTDGPANYYDSDSDNDNDSNHLHYDPRFY